MVETKGTLIPIVPDRCPDHGPQGAIVPGLDLFLLALDHRPGDAEEDEETVQVAMVAGVGEARAIVAIVVMMIGVEAEAVDGVVEVGVR